MLNIKVIPKAKPTPIQNVLSLTVIKKMNEKGKIVVSVVGEGKDDNGISKKRWSSCIWEGEATTSTALGKWVCYEFKDELLELKSNVHTLKEGKDYYAVDVGEGLYGIYFDLLKGKVCFDERVGMKTIEHILSLIGVKVEKTMINGKLKLINLIY